MISFHYIILWLCGDYDYRIFPIKFEIKDTTVTSRFALRTTLSEQPQNQTSKSRAEKRGMMLTLKLLNQGFLLAMLKSSLRKFYDRHDDLVDHYGISVSQMTSQMNTDMFRLLLLKSRTFLVHDFIFGNTVRGYAQICKCDARKWHHVSSLSKQTLLIQLSIVERFHFLSSLILIERQPVLCIWLHDPS